ncbi:MAG TPA: PAS domain S-box protein, partial [Terriglobales bacterium]|nr:PAS domain S-box protein [Terriglobales bacterium]
MTSGSPDNLRTAESVKIPGRSPRVYVWMCLVVLLGGVASSILFWHQLRLTENEHGNRRTRLALEAIRADLAEDTKQRVFSIDRLSRIWGLDVPPPEEERKYLAKLVIEENRGFRKIEFVDTANRITEVITLNGSEAGVDRSVAHDPLLLEATMRAAARKGFAATREYTDGSVLVRDLVQPVFNHDQLRGFIVVNVDVRESMIDMLANTLELGYLIAVTEHDVEIYSSDTSDAILKNQWVQRIDFDTAADNWTIFATPGPRLASTFQTSLPEAALIFGLAVTGLLTFLLYLVRVIARRESDLAYTNAELINSFEQRRLGEAALRESEARFSAILEMSSDAVLATDEEQKIILFNTGATQVFGYSEEEIVGKPLSILIPERFRQVHGEYIKDYGAADGQPRAMSPVRPIVGVRKNGAEFPIEASISKLVLKGKLMFTAILRDATERYQAEEALLQMHAQL